MKCDRCDQEATVHEVRVVGSKKVEKHLCERCAKDQGIAIQPHLPINELIQKYVLAQGAGGAQAEGAAPAAKISACPACGMGYAEFRQTGLLGCPDCYKAFEPQLGPLLERAHEGGVRHVGKVPRRALAAASSGEGGSASTVLGGTSERTERRMALHRQLEEAVKAEQYERAATLRDELRRLDEFGGPSPAPAPPAKGKKGQKPDASHE